MALNKRAFTLAEVLITLGIIGVVAAVTMPTVITNYQKHVTVSRLKSTYALLSQALNLAIKDYDEIFVDSQYYGCENAVQVSEKYFEPYLKVLKKCNCSTVGECEFDRGTMDGNPPQPAYELVYYSERAQRLFLANGSEVLVSRPPGDPGIIVLIIDINGNNKPNVYGKDVFRFKVEPSGQIKAFTEPEERDSIIMNCKSIGTACSALILTDGWKISKDYPW